MIMSSMLNYGNLARWFLISIIICLIKLLLVNGSTSCNSFSSNSFSCDDLNGVGSFNTTCFIKSDTLLSSDLCIYGSGNLHLSPNTKLTCPIKGCRISVNLTGYIEIGSQALITAGSIKFNATNIFLNYKSIVNATALGGEPPSQTSGIPQCCEKAGGGHGGRGASCLKLNKTNWGGDVYAWSTLSDPWSYGSKGGIASSKKECAGDGGGRVALWANKSLVIEGFVLAEGGEGGMEGGGGSGGSIVIHAFKL
jgi:hypothetical protein